MFLGLHVSDLVVEIRACLRLAIPIVLAQLAMMGSRVADTIMAGRLSATDLAAVASGASYWMILGLLVIGLANGLSPIVAQQRGRGDSPILIGDYIQQCLWVAALVGAAWYLMMWSTANPLMGQLGLSAEATEAATGYLQAVALGAPATSVMLVLRFGADGMGEAKPFLLIGVVGLVVNVLLNYMLMWGNWGAPQLGAVGCGYATAIADTVMLLLFLVAYRFYRPLRALQIFAAWARPRRETVLDWMRVGVPIAVMLTFEAGFFGATALVMARFGDVPAAAHQIAMNYSSVCFMVPLGFAFATTVRVGHAIGRGQPAAAQRAGWTGVGLSLIFAGFSATLMLLAPGWIVGLYTDSEAVAPLAVRLLFWAALFQFFDCLQASSAGALRGFKDTRWPMLITLVAYWAVGMPLGAGLAFAGGYGPDALWWGIIVGLGTAAVLLSWRLARRGAWRLAVADA